MAQGNPNPSPATRFQPGQTGNPGGRPKGRSITSRLRELLEDDRLTHGRRGKKILDQIAERIIRESLDGDHKFVETLLERTEGKVPIAIQGPAVDLEAARDKLKEQRDERNGGQPDPDPRPVE